MIVRNDLRHPEAPSTVEVFQLTRRQVPACHIYMEAQIFAPDSSCFILHESATAHGSDKNDPQHRYFVCDLRNKGALHPITDELGPTAPSMSPDGRHLYYFVNETEINGGRLILKRVKLDGSERETLFVVDAPLPGTNSRPHRIYPLSTIRSDGKKIALSCCLGDGRVQPEPYGLMVFDLEKPSVCLVLEGPTWLNMHPQYCRSTDPEGMRDILVQENHADEPGTDIHVVRDDGTNFRNMPWCRAPFERSQGHQCWRGRTPWGITSTHSQYERREQQLIESQAVPHTGHVGAASPGGVRNHLSRRYPWPVFYHFATDIAGRRLVTDAGERRGWGRILTAQLGEPGRDALSSWTSLAVLNRPNRAATHPHPFLSPDGTMAFFNSDETGILQAYMVRGLETLTA